MAHFFLKLIPVFAAYFGVFLQVIHRENLQRMGEKKHPVGCSLRVL
jgi:hypothetical protein